MARYEVVLQPDGDTWMVTAPAFEEVTTFGATQEEAVRHGRDAIEEAIAGRIADGEDVPAPLPDTAVPDWFVEVSAA